MGLLLSVLVVCVGVIELLTFYHNVRRNVNPVPIQTDLTTVKSNYMKDLYGLRDRIYNELQTILGKPIETSSSDEEPGCSTKPPPPIVRLTSHEDIELEYNPKLVERSRSPGASRRFLLTETESRSRSPSPRHFVVTEEPTTTNGNTNLPEFHIQEHDSNRYVLKDSVIPLPKQFLVTDEEINQIQKDRSPSPIEFQRSPSPYPTFELTAPRNSICSELNDVSVVEVDEELYRSKSPSPEPPVILESPKQQPSVTVESPQSPVTLESTSFDSTEYWNNKILVVPEKKSKSRSPSPHKKQSPKENCLASNEVIPGSTEQTTVLLLEAATLETQLVNEINETKTNGNTNKHLEELTVCNTNSKTGEEITVSNGNDVKLNESFLNDLDGLPQKPFKRNTGSRKSIKNKKRNKTPTNLGGVASTSSTIDEKTADDTTGANKVSDEKKAAPEAFWVGKN